MVRGSRPVVTYNFGLGEQLEDARRDLGPEFHDGVQSARVVLWIICHVNLLAVHGPELKVDRKWLIRWTAHDVVDLRLAVDWAYLAKDERVEEGGHVDSWGLWMLSESIQDVEYVLAYVVSAVDGNGIGDDGSLVSS